MADTSEDKIEVTENEEWKTAAKGKKRKRANTEKMDDEAAEQGSAMDVSQRPYFPPVKKEKLQNGTEVRKIPVPAHRYTPLKENWMKIFTPVVEQLNLQIRFNLKIRNVEIRTCKETTDVSNLQKAADFVRAFILGFEVDDALALLRLDDIFIDSFDIQDVKQLKGDHLSRAIGRLAGKNGKTKFTIENQTRTRIVVADHRVHILGAFSNTAAARRALCELILGSPPSKVFGHIRNVVVT
ncbi:RNA-binding protein PNO1 [Amphibalanus amphitrite]|uniref:RNA-binding protein PNO1 n=1 Tax=Amphibalanus amphitrite TaxID=1232801 RepID=A0A6A4VJJ0_AMPAM|nr:RNA-binding protein PNO1-like [Amphibalanus amphitrite]XP_043196581.1 RNA-binding protein PNO1-like [Amphibalanus amphitrite]XP_043196582.1 RNA-binding protein PNO1-like [Amphibalanus amphitrite]KAF0294185.1 RNA-binding protein PNO1 [Amphibalanus amphitrite]